MTGGQFNGLTKHGHTFVSSGSVFALPPRGLVSATNADQARSRRPRCGQPMVTIIAGPLLSARKNSQVPLRIAYRNKAMRSY